MGSPPIAPGGCGQSCSSLTARSQNMKRILFVDDESDMLLLFETSLRQMGGDFELLFAESGEEALALMEHTPIHVVVSDLVMPKMDGAQFLNEVMRRFPDTIRFILSGHIGPEDVAKCIRALHQHLRKPCDFSTLKTTLIRVCSLEVFLQNKPLQKLVTSMGIVPSLPS